MPRSAASQILARAMKDLGYKVKAGDGTNLKYLANGPYVRVDPAAKARWVIRTKVLRLLETFYRQGQPRDPGARLILRRIGVFGSFLLVTQDADVMDLLSGREYQKRLARHRREFVRLATYLQNVHTKKLASLAR